MKLKPAILLFLIVAIPVTLLAWIGARLARHEREIVQQQVRDLLTDRLRDIDGRIGRHFEELGREMHRLTAVDVYESERLRQACRDEPRVLQLFVIRPDGSLLHPDPLGPLNRNEQDFLTRASQIITDRELQRAAEARFEDRQAGDPATSATADPAPAKGGAGRARASGWFVWYWGRGLNLVYWQRRDSGHLVAAALDRSRWIADLIGVLPDTPRGPGSGAGEAGSSRSQIRLIDSTSKPVYQWGAFDPRANAVAAGEIPLSSPLSAWRLQQFVPPERLTTGATHGVYFNLATGLSVAALGLVGMAVYLYREYTRDLREAEQRVSFVNQVSHELRTPLTNIRMYADLLESDLEELADDSAGRPRSHLSVIQLEGQRLSRLIGNVLTFARQQKRTLRLNRKPCCIDAVVRGIVERFRPSLQQAGIQCEFTGRAGRTVAADADAIEQILGNLINNVEKYAVAGEWMAITTRQEPGRTTITVADRGPGVARSAESAIFEPFWRGDHRVSGVAGTGIGLSIARELARLHGGDVAIVPADVGAVFQVDLATPDAAGKGSACTS